MTYPGYQSLYEIATSLGATVSRWEPRISEGINFNIEDLNGLIQEDTKCIVLNFPHNPTGATISQDTLDGIIELARVRGIYIFSDEMYRLLEYSDEGRLSSVSDIYEKGVSLSGMSKTFSLPGPICLKAITLE